MTATIRPMTRDDAEDAHELWNAVSVHDQVSRGRFERVIFGDPHQAAGGLLLISDGDGLAGFAVCVTPAAEVDWLAPFGYLKALCARGYDAGGPAGELLAAVEGFAASQRTTGVHVTEYAAGGYFTPGIDLHYEGALGLLRRSGYEQGHEIQDVALDLPTFELSEWAAQAECTAAAEGIEIVPYDPAMLGSLAELVDAINMPQWFGEGWQDHRRTRGNTFVAVQQGRVIGYADYSPGREIGGFGTTAVRPDLRGRGIGSCLLTACIRALQEAGTPLVVAGWANTPFYLKNGWHIYRRYATFHKDV